MASRQVECSLLSRMLASRSVAEAVLATLEPKDFGYAEHRMLCQAIFDVLPLSTNGAAPDDLLVQKRLGELAPASTEPLRVLSEVRHAAFDVADSYINAYIDEIRESAERRALRILSLELDRYIEEGAPTDVLRDFLDASFDNIQRGFTPQTAWSGPHRAADILATDLPAITSILGNGTLIDGGLHLITGAPGLGKSWLMTQLQVSLAMGHEFMGLETTPTKVGMIAMELPIQEYQRRLNTTLEHLGPPRELITKSLEDAWFLGTQDTKGSIDLRDADTVKRIVGLIETTNAELLILDPASRLHSYDENDASEMAHFIGTLDTLRVQTGCAILLVHHEPKSTRDLDDVYAARGSGRFASDPTSILRLKRHPKTEQLLLVSAKQNFGTAFEPIGLTYTPGGPYRKTETLHALSQKRKGDLVDQIRAYLFDMYPQSVTLKQIMEATDYATSSRTYQRHLASIEKISKTGTGRSALYRLGVPDDPAYD